MSAGRCTEDEYLEEAFEFLRKYQWMFNFKNTEILTRNVLANFPSEWKDYFTQLTTDELHHLVTGALKVPRKPAPPDLQAFISDLNALNPHLQQQNRTQERLLAQNAGISRKKSHEIALLAPGHLSQLLHSKYGYAVLGLEASRKLVETAQSNQAKRHPQSIGEVVFEELFVDASSAPQLNHLIVRHFNGRTKACLTGLHACADLSVEVQRLFMHLSIAEALVMMPCCYHRMLLAKEDAGRQWFGNFPVSQKGKVLWQKHGGSGFLRQSFLRLACQQTREAFIRMSEEEHRKHGQRCLQRAVLQLAAELENCTVRRVKRKSGKSDAPDIDGGFQEYLNNLSGTHELVLPNPETRIRITDARFLSRMHEKWTAHKTDCRQVEVLMGLQGAIQALCENNRMEYDYNDKLAFQAEWFDYDSAYQKKFILNYYPSNNTLELFDRELNRMYLKRNKIDGLDLKDMFVGNTIRVYGRQVRITDYLDCRTKQIIGKTKEHTFTLIKPNLIPKLGEVITEIQRSGFQICNMKMCNLTRKEVLDLHEPYKGDSYLPFILEHLVSGSVVALELVGENAVEKWLEVLGPDDPLEAKKTAPNSLRALYGKDSKALNGFHASADLPNAIREAEFFFPKEKSKNVPESTVLLQNTTCCVVKPHAILEGKLGHVLSAINESHYKITALQMFYLNNANADEFLEVYKGVVSDYHAMLLSFIDGPCVALEIAGKTRDLNVHSEFRMFCGPSDSDIARQIRPATLRARFGCDKYKNAVHCTDLPEDTRLELEYFFQILKD
ncbi:hypothetical protein HUJ04_013001 [Dendroctonus ponderosae]|nr:hypothetical protein HUJ04_013001 [Dendroctonus ponderosae]